VTRYAVRRLEDVPVIPPEEPAEPNWYPLQHYFRFTGFGANVYVARADGGELLGLHDEAASGQEELYLVVAGEATFTLDGEAVDAPALTVVAVPDPTVVRGATAKTACTTVIAIGNEARDAFRSSWQAKWFEGAPQV
jgi:quercetin dioxygenase-like cupin family protein